MSKHHHSHHNVDYTGLQTTEAVIAQLENVLAGLKSGSLVVEDQTGRHELKPTDQTKFSMEIKDSHHGQSLKMKLKWRERQESEMWETGPLNIYSPKTE